VIGEHLSRLQHSRAVFGGQRHVCEVGSAGHGKCLGSTEAKQLLSIPMRTVHGERRGAVKPLRVTGGSAGLHARDQQRDALEDRPGECSAACDSCAETPAHNTLPNTLPNTFVATVWWASTALHRQRPILVCVARVL
jgi:hypothetical protein